MKKKLRDNNLEIENLHGVPIEKFLMGHREERGGPAAKDEN